MTAESMRMLTSGWTRLGAMFNVPSARDTPHLERLLLETVREAPVNSRLFTMAATWLVHYGEYVAKQQLVRLIQAELEPEHRAVMGLLLESVAAKAPRHLHRFAQAVEACVPASDPRPLFDVDRRSHATIELARQGATGLSRKWGRWMREIELKEDALRPAHWVAAQNPALRVRALLGGDLAASIIADCGGRKRIFDSEVDLARSVGGSRIAVRDALHKLELAGLARRTKHGRSNRIEIRPGIAA